MAEMTELQRELDRELDQGLISRRPADWGSGTIGYLETRTVIDQANRIFGYGAWSTELLGVPQMVGNGYMAALCVTVRRKDMEASYCDVGYCPLVREGGEKTAVKGAVSDALKRCLRHFGPQFGNSLYEDEAKAAPEERRPEEHIVAEVQEVADVRGEGGAPWEITLVNRDTGECETLPCYLEVIPNYAQPGSYVKVAVATSKKGRRYIKALFDEGAGVPERVPGRGDNAAAHRLHRRIQSQLTRLAHHMDSDSSEVLGLFDDLSRAMFGVPSSAIQDDQRANSLAETLARCSNARDLINAIENARMAK